MNKPLRVLVCGGRDFGNEEANDEGYAQWEFGMEWLEERFKDVERMYIISGGARGADSIGEDYTFEKVDRRLLRFPADWNTHGKKAGFIRNTQMLEEGKPDLVIAFPGGKGTEMMISIAEKAGVPVERVTYDG